MRRSPRSRLLYSKRRNCMLAALEKYMPEGTQLDKPEGGMFIWVTLPKGMDGAEAARRNRLETAKVAFVPGQARSSPMVRARIRSASASPARQRSQMIEEGISPSRRVDRR